MAKPGPEVAVFNLERTITDDVFTNALDDIIEAGLQPTWSSTSDGLPIREQRARLLGWLTNKRLVDVQPLLDVTAEQTANRIAPWARLVMSAELTAGRQLSLYSATVPQEILEAYAEGIGDVVPGANIRLIFGKRLNEGDGRFNGTAAPMLKAETIEKMQANGYMIDLIADSFVQAFPALRKANRILGVNPERPFYRGVDCAYTITKIYWDVDHPARTKVYLPDESRAIVFDLGHQSDQANFLRAMYSTPRQNQRA